MADNTTRDLITGQKQTNKKLDSLNETIKKQMGDVSDAVKKPPKKDIEGKKEAQQNQKTFLSNLLKGINKAMTGSMKGAKAGAGMLGKFLKFGLGFIMVPFLGLIGVIAGVISGIMKSKEVKFMLGILKTIGKTAIGFVKFMGSIARWMLNLLPGGKLGTGLFNIFGKMGKTISSMFGGWTAKIAGLLEHPKIVKVMGQVSKFIRPLARVAFWLFSAWEFLKGWKQADEIFGKGEGEATIVEKFAGGIGAIIQFLSFGFIDTEKAAKALKKTFEFFGKVITNPQEAWKDVTKWWKDFSFNDSVVKPMLEMFDDFPKKVRAFIDGPLSNFGSKAVEMLKGFIFGKDDPDSTEGTGGLWGGVKSLFSAENIVNAIAGFVKLTAGFYKMLGSLVSIIFIGTQGNWTDLKSWKGLFGWIKDDLFNWDNIVGVVKAYLNIWKSVGIWLGDIFGGLFTRAMGYLEEKFGFKIDFKMPEFNLIEGIKEYVRNILETTLEWVPGLGKIRDWAGAKAAPISEEQKKEFAAIDKKEADAKKARKEEADARGGMRYKDFKMQQEKAYGAVEGQNAADWTRSVGGLKAAKAMWKASLTGGGGTPAEDILKSGAVRMAKGQTRASSWTGQSEFAKHKMNIMGSMFKGGIRVTSGYRDPKRGNEAMLQSKEGLSKYRDAQKRFGLTDKELNAAAGTEARASGIAKMRAKGFSSQHEHGNAIDFSYPSGYSEDNFSALKGKILGTFPGANLIKEKDHLHMAFNKANTGVQLAALQTEQGQLASSSSGTGTGGNVTIVKEGDSTSTESFQMAQSPFNPGVHGDARVATSTG